MTRRLLALLALLVLSVQALAGGAPSETVVLVNTRSEDSRRVAEHYVRARQIPPTNVCRVDCDTALTTTRDVFVRDVVDPLREHLRTTGIEERVRFIVLTQGMPIRAGGKGGHVSTAAMLELLDTPICGADGARMPRVRNPYTAGPAPFTVGGDTQRLYLVTALLSSTADEAIAMVDRSVASDGTAPENAHFVYQDANGAAGNRNPHYDAARTAIERKGHATEHVKSGVDVVVGRKRVMGYMSGGAYSKLSPEKVRENEYLPGALCDMLQSFGSVPENFAPDGKGGKQFPVTHMVRAGVTGVHGTVAEPYNIAFPSADLFTPYVEGYTLAEAFHQKLPFRYWMNLVMGDPLCAPYAERLAIDVDVSEPEDDYWINVKAIAPGAVEVQIFLDGVWTHRGSPERAAAVFDMRTLRPGLHRVLVEATGKGAHEPKSWTTVEFNVDNPVSRPIRQPNRIAFGGDLRIPLTSMPKSHAFSLVGTSAPLPFEMHLTDDSLQIDFDWSAAAALSGTTADVQLTLDGELFEWSALIGPSALRVESDASVTAGTRAALRITAVGADGESVKGWSERVSLYSTTPPVRWAHAVLDETGTATLPFVSALAGRYDLLPRLASGLAADTVAIDVTAGAAHHATTPLSRLPLGQATDIPIRFEDRFGNAVGGDARTLSVTFPDDPHARAPGKLSIEAGASGAKLRDVVLSKAGRQRIIIKDASGKTWSQPGEGVDVRPDAIRAWSVTGARRGDDAAALFAGDPADGVDGPGAVSGDLLFRRVRDTDATVDLPTWGARDGDAACAVTFVDALSDTEASLRLSAAARTRVFLDGKSVFDGTPAENNPRKAGKEVAKLTLAKGRHRLTVVTERKGRFAFRLGLAAGKAAFAPTLRIRPDSGAAPASLCVSGAVTLGGRSPIRDAAITLKDAKGTTHEARTGPDGVWSLTGVAAGDAAVRLVSSPGTERTISVGPGHTTDVDFRLADDAPPTIQIPAAPQKAARTLRIDAQISDAGGIHSAWLSIDGERVASTILTRAPWRLELDVAARERGAITIVVHARDRAGNAAQSEALSVVLVKDSKGPKIGVRGLSRNAVLKKSTEVTATISDPIGVASVTFLLGDAPLGERRSAPPYTVTLDPTALAAGRHVLTCIARDADGNESKKELPFRVK